MFKIGAGKKKGVITPLILLPCKRLGLFSPGVKITGIKPPLRGIVQLTNSAAPIVTFRLFAFGIGVSTINYHSEKFSSSSGECAPL
jgi:hypothetical protein